MDLDDKIAELFQQLLEDGYTVEQAADMAYLEFKQNFGNINFIHIFTV